MSTDPTMPLKAEALRGAAALLIDGHGPDMSAGSDETYAFWLLDLAERIDTTEDPP